MTKGLKTFNLNHSTIRIVKRKPNQSAFVDKAIIEWDKKESEFTLSDIPTRQLMAALQQRDDCPRHIKIILWDQIKAETR